MHLTVITAKKPEILSKSFTLAGQILQKHPGGNLIEGVAEALVLNPPSFAELLAGLNPAQALVFGVTGHRKARVITKEALPKARGGSIPNVARDREHFSWAVGSGVLMIDYDPAGDPLTRDELLRALYGVWPELEGAPHVWTPSASSCIYRTDSGEELRGIMGQRVYVPVRNAVDIPRAGAALHERLFLAGLGRFDLSRAGTLLERSLADSQVWQPERLDFAGGAQCGPGLEQRRPAPVILNGDGEYIDSRTLVDLSAAETKSLEGIKTELRRAMEPEARQRRTEWIEERVTETSKNKGGNREALRDMFTRAVEQRRLLADFVLHSEQFGAVTVGHILDNPDRFHNTRFADPLEPKYGNDKRIAFASLRTAGRPYIYSHAHGGTRYTLHRAVQTVQLHGGELSRIADRTLELMSIDGIVYDLGGVLTRITDGHSFIVTPGWLAYYLGGLVAFQKYDKRTKKYEPADCPERLTRTIIDLVGQWGLPRLENLITVPSITPNGRVIQEDGFDRETGIYLHFPDRDAWNPIPDKPTDDQVEAAVRAFFRPFRDFPYETVRDRGVCLAGALGAVVQAQLPLKPGLAIDAPTPGTGKTKLAESISILAGGSGAVNAPPDAEKEMEHLLVQQLIDCSPVLVIDNVSRLLSSGLLCAYMTGTKYKGRVLGLQRFVEGRPGMVIVTGNGLLTAEDMNRRFLRLRIDPQCEKPQERSFDIDPPAYVRDHRLELVHAALTILRASIVSDYAGDGKRLGSYEVWSDFIRRAVLWIGAKGWLEVADPVESIAENFENDPETETLGRLLNAWLERFGKDGATMPEAKAKTFSDDDFKQILTDVAGRDGAINWRRMGIFISRRKARIVGGLQFKSAGTRLRYTVWVVKSKTEKHESHESHESFPSHVAKMASDSFDNRAETDSSDSSDSCNYEEF